MKKNSAFRRSLLLAYGAVLVFALLLMAVYMIASPSLFAHNRAQDLLPRGRLIADYIESTLSGDLPSSYLAPIISRNASQWDAAVWVVDIQGRTLIRTQTSGKEQVGALPQILWDSMIPTVLQGSDATLIASNNALSAPSSPDKFSQRRLVSIAVPIRYDSKIIGAVFMAQTLEDALADTRVFTNTLLLAMVAMLLLLLPFLYLFAGRITRPLKDIRDTALMMAGGDLSVRADESRRDEYGELGHVLNMLSSELGRTISTLQMERNRLRSIVEGMSEGILALNSDGSLSFINASGCRLLELPQDGAGLRSRAPEVLSLFDQALLRHEPVSDTLWRGETALHISITPLHDGEQSGGVVGILTDVTSVERLEQTRRDYVANVSHELRTPLTAMRALMEPLRDGMVTSEEQRQQIYSVVLRETMRLSRLVSDMLELSRLQSGTASMEISVFQPRQVLESVRDIYLPYAEDYQTRFIYDVPPDLPSIRGNPDRTQQVLVALVDNAFKYTGEGGTVTLSVLPCPDYLQVSVRDTGVGISEADLPHVFERFYKVDKSHHSKGTGLGLAIASEIMHQLGETLTVTSELGKGSCFSLTLHYAQEDPSSRQ